ncbi:MFS transporter [Brachybacterium sp. ACRRE]|uniref:MFS transporter n=1 Tax=Brachybacterium sp. ACRRE TaxID=2918184 RepID=UPI001EF25BFE|nr:MFS transporter [Brachybacterium sp. ACRRE]MCG7309624.1 MFS transporter [Brachybacterium sp. ACRRE]
MVNLLGTFDGMVVTVALPAIQSDLGLDPLSGQWIIGLHSLALGSVLITAGRLGDKWGRRRCVISGLIVVAGGLTLAAVAPSPAFLFVARALQGFGSGLAIPNIFGIVSSYPDAGVRTRTMAAIAVAGSSGSVLGGVVGGALMQAGNWRLVFGAIVPVALGSAVLCLVSLPKDRPDRQSRAPGVVGAGLVFVAVLLTVQTITSLSDLDSLSWTVLIFVVGTVGAWLAVVMHLRRSPNPIIAPRVLHVRSLQAAALGMPGQVFAYQGSVYLCLLGFQEVYDWSPLKSGVAFAPLGLTCLLTSLVVSRIIKDRGWRRTTLISQTLCTLGLFAIAASWLFGYGIAALGLALLGIGIAISAVTYNLAAGINIDTDDKATAYGFFETSTHLAGAVVVAVLASSLALSASLPTSAQFTVAFMVAGLGCISMTIASMVRDPREQVLYEETRSSS